MKRTVAIIILSICLIGVGGWGAFSYTEVQQQQRTIREQDISIRELQQEREGFIAFVSELNTEMNGLLIKIWPQGEANVGSYLQDIDLDIKLEKLGTGIEELIEENAEQQRMIEAAEQYVYQLEDRLEAATFELGKDMPVKPTEARWFDCDDSAIYMFYYFTNMGYEVDIVEGNLDLTGEWQLGCDHTWIIVHSNGVAYPYDWGEYCPDPQHHEYYEIGFIELLLAGIIG